MKAAMPSSFSSFVCLDSEPIPVFAVHSSSLHKYISHSDVHTHAKLGLQVFVYEL